MEGEVLSKNLTMEQLDGTVSVVESGNIGGEGGVEPVSVGTENPLVREPLGTVALCVHLSDVICQPGSLSKGVARATILAAKRTVWEPLSTDALCTAGSVHVSLGESCGVTKSLLDSNVPEARFSEQCSEFVQSLHPPVLSTLSIHAVKFRPQASYSLGHAVVQSHSTNFLDVTAAVFRPARASSACAVVIADTAFHVTPP